jgi:hypothetical protein
MRSARRPDGFHVIDVAEREDPRGVSLRVVVESPPRQEGRRVCGVIAHSHGRRTVRLVDALCMDPAGAAAHFAASDPSG